MSTHPFDASLGSVAAALRAGRISAVELTEQAIASHERHAEHLAAYVHFDAEGARRAARRADEMLGRAGAEAPPLCGIPVSVKDLYGVEGLPTWAGTRRRLPGIWSRDGWLVGRLRDQGAVFMGKTHTVELAYGALGVNPNWTTPRNPWDSEVHRVPGGSSSGAGVSLHEGSALVALGTDTGGSIRIPASFTGVVGHKTTKGRWPTSGVVPLSHTLDTVGALTRTAEDAAWFFASVDPALGDPDDFMERTSRWAAAGMRLAVPRCRIWSACQEDVARVLEEAIGALTGAGCRIPETDGALLDRAADLYMTAGIAGFECRGFLARDLPEWSDLLHPIVGTRLEAAAAVTPTAYADALARRSAMEAEAEALFAEADVLVLPTALITPPSVREVEDLGAYGKANGRALRPTCPVSILGLCAVTVPVGRDQAGMPVGMQLVARRGRDEEALAAALAVERAVGRLPQPLRLPFAAAATPMPPKAAPFRRDSRSKER